MLLLTRIACVLTGMAILCGSAGAVPINFETTPTGGTPVDDAILDTPYNIFGTLVYFGNDTDGDGLIDVYAHFEDYYVDGSGELGNSPTDAEALHGFTHFSTNSPAGMPDFYYADLDMTADHSGGFGTAVGEGGAFMIRQQRDGDDGATTSVDFLDDPFLIFFDGVLPTAISGQIWDVDRAAGGQAPFSTEQYLIEALDINGTVLAFDNSPTGLPYTDDDTLSGKPWPWSFAFSPGTEIKAIRISKGDGWVNDDQRGFAFDNFELIASPNVGGGPPVPEPVTMLLGGLGMLTLVFRRHRAG